MSTEIMNIKNVRAYQGNDGIVYLNLEDVARGLGFTTVATSGNEVVRWARVRGYLNEFDFGIYADNENTPAFIPENIFYKLCFKAKNETAKQFQDLVTDEVLPSIRKNGFYGTNEFLDIALNDPDLAINLIQNFKNAKEEARIAREKEKIAREQQELAEMKMRKAQYGQAIAQKKTDIISDELKTVSGDIKYARALSSKHENNITWTEMLALINKNRVKKIGKKNFLQELRDRKVLQTQKRNWNLPYGEYLKKDYFLVNKEPVYSKGVPVINPYTGEQRVNRVVLTTPAGQKFLLKKFCGIKESEIIWLNEDEIENIRLEEMNYDPERIV